MGSNPTLSANSTPTQLTKIIQNIKAKAHEHYVSITYCIYRPFLLSILWALCGHLWAAPTGIEPKSQKSNRQLGGKSTRKDGDDGYST